MSITFVNTDTRPARILIDISDCPLPPRRVRPTAADLCGEEDPSISPEEYLRLNEPVPRTKREIEESAVYDRLYKYKAQPASQYAMKDRVVAKHELA